MVELLADVGRPGAWQTDKFGLDRLHYWPGIQVTPGRAVGVDVDHVDSP